MLNSVVLALSLAQFIHGFLWELSFGGGPEQTADLVAELVDAGADANAWMARHTLSTENLPVLRTLIGVPFGGKSPFTAEVWFVNRVTNLDVRWGTPDAIQLQDPKYGVMVPVRAFGQYGIRITDPKKFLLKLVGTLPGFDSDTLAEYFRGVFITRIKTEIANAITRAGISVLEISTQLEALSSALKASLSTEMAEYGVGLAQFNIHSINVPEEDPAVKSLKAALAKRAEMGIIGFTYQQERSFNVMETAAGNEGAAGSVLGAGLGLGMGVGMGPALGQSYSQLATQIQPQAPAPSAPSAAMQPPASPNGGASRIGAAERIQLLKDLAELRATGILSDSEFEAEKQKILAS